MTPGVCIQPYYVTWPLHQPTVRTPLTVVAGYASLGVSPAGVGATMLCRSGLHTLLHFNPGRVVSLVTGHKDLSLMDHRGPAGLLRSRA